MLMMRANRGNHVHEWARRRRPASERPAPRARACCRASSARSGGRSGHDRGGPGGNGREAIIFPPPQYRRGSRLPRPRRRAPPGISSRAPTTRPSCGTTSTATRTRRSRPGTPRLASTCSSGWRGSVSPRRESAQAEGEASSDPSPPKLDDCLAWMQRARNHAEKLCRCFPASVRPIWPFENSFGIAIQGV
jgi:hypothetical protein